ncbi:rubrerythrin family protein [Streptomyces tendae]|uniref:rubrerythrin family protein n=1 Tax=Streptomyces tendae TaxID=1932 RepID=UPI0036ADF199
MAELNGRMYDALRAAFQTESMNVQRYAHFAEIAEIEGHVALASIFRDLQASAACVARGHLDLLQDVADPATATPIGESALNVAAGLNGELSESTDLYPALVAEAHEEGLADVAGWLETLCLLKTAHTTRLQLLLDGFVQDRETA